MCGVTDKTQWHLAYGGIDFWFIASGRYKNCWLFERGVTIWL